MSTLIGPDSHAPVPSPVVVAQFLARAGAHVAVVRAPGPYPFSAFCEACGPVGDTRSGERAAVRSAEEHAAKCLRLPARLWVPIPGAASTGTDVAL